MRNAALVRRLQALGRICPGVSVVTARFLSHGSPPGWRIGAVLDSRWAGDETTQERLALFTRWPHDELALGASPRLRAALTQASRSLADLRTLLSCPECGSVREPA